jgi:phage RecT family recombinase
MGTNRQVQERQEEQERPSAVAIAGMLRTELVNRQEMLASLLNNPGDDEVARYIESIITVCVKSPDLLSCSVESILLAVREAAGYGIMPTGNFEGGWLVPRKGKAIFQFSYRGLLDRVYESPRIASIDAKLCYAGEDWSIDLGTDQRVIHPWSAVDKGDVEAGYMQAFLHGAPKPIVVPMTRAEIDKVMRSTPNWNGKNSPWKNWYESMSLKTVLKNGVRLLPMGASAIRAIQHDNEASGIIEGEAQSVALSSPQRAQRRLQALRQAPEQATEQEDEATEGATEEKGKVTEQEEQPPTPEPDEKPPEPTTATCGHIPDPNPLNIEHACTKAAGHKGVHKSDDGTWGD